MLLIERRTGGVRLTPAGADLLPHIRLVLVSVDRAKQEGEAHRGLAKGSVGLGIIPTATPPLLARLLRRSKELYPGIRIHVVEGVAATLAHRVRKGRLDLALVMLPLDLRELAVVELGTARLGLAISNHHPLVGRTSVP